MRDTPAVSNILARTGSIVKPSVPHGIHDVCLSCDLLVVGDDDDALMKQCPTYKEEET